MKFNIYIYNITVTSIFKINISLYCIVKFNFKLMKYFLLTKQTFSGFDWIEWSQFISNSSSFRFNSSLCKNKITVMKKAIKIHNI